MTTIKHLARIGLAAGLLAVLAACEPSGVQFFETENPRRLSAWNVLAMDGDYLRAASDSTPYALNSVLFSDYAHKFRTLWTPPDTTITTADGETLVFPTGTIISKTFFYPRGTAGLTRTTDQDQFVDWQAGAVPLDQVRLIETRLLVKRERGWVALPYVWNEQQTEAFLEPVGDLVPLTIGERESRASFTYVVPDQNQCAGCHATNHASKQINPIGPTVSNLARDGQLSAWQARHGLVAAGTAMADWRDEHQEVDARARSYLHINCGHCHSPTGPGDTSGLYLTLATNDAGRLGICKPPIAAGQGTGGHAYSIVPGMPLESILVYRMQTLDPGAMMPEVGRSLAHTEGIALVSDWIDAMPGECDPAGRMFDGQ